MFTIQCKITPVQSFQKLKFKFVKRAWLCRQKFAGYGVRGFLDTSTDNIRNCRPNINRSALLHHHFTAHQNLFDFPWINPNSCDREINAKETKPMGNQKVGGWLVFHNVETYRTYDTCLQTEKLFFFSISSMRTLPTAAAQGKKKIQWEL